MLRPRMHTTSRPRYVPMPAVEPVAPDAVSGTAPAGCGTPAMSKIVGASSMIVLNVCVMLPFSLETCEPEVEASTAPAVIARPSARTSIPLGNLARKGTRTPPSVVKAL